MPNSIKCKIKHLCHNGTLTERERDRILKALEQEPCEDATLKDIFCMGCEYKEQEPILDKIRAEIKEWYWQADKQALAKDPCVVDAMIDLFIRTIDKYKTESEDEDENNN